MFRAVLTMHVDATHVETFERAWKHAAESFAAVPGLIRQTLAADAHDSGCLTITSDWTDEQSFRLFEVSSRQDDATAALRRLRTSSTMHTQDVRLIVAKEDR